MNNLKTVYEAEIEVLSPLHIGTGRALQRGYDYTVQASRTWRIDEDKLFQEVYLRSEADHAALNRLLLARPAEELLVQSDYRDHPEFFRYVMPGQPRAEGKGAELRECLKNGFDQPYVPGSSFKGALRTVLAWAIFRAENMRIDMGDMGRNRSWGGQTIERDIFGRNPNYDLLRALQVADSEPAGKESLMLANVAVVVASISQAPIEVEALMPGTRLKLTLTLDEYLLSEAVARKLDWREKPAHLRKLAIHARNLASARIKEEQAHMEGRPALSRVSQFYDALGKLHAQLKGSEDFLVQMSWGGGWNAKTLGDQIPDDQLEEIINRFQLSRSLNRQPGDPFPRSRRMYFDRHGPAMPMGWVMVRVKERS